MKKHKTYLMPAAALAILTLIFGIFFLQYQENEKVKSIVTFEQCANAGYPILTSYPEQCLTPDKRTFTKPIVQQSTAWTEQRIEEIGMRFNHPGTMTFSKVFLADKAINKLTFTLEQTDKSYTLYGVFQGVTVHRTAASALAALKKNLDPTTIEPITINGYQGIKGLIVEEQPKHVISIDVNNDLLTFYTYPITDANKELTNKILQSMIFE